MEFAALVAALALFWISTRQFHTLWRLLIWVLAVASLTLAWFTADANRLDLMSGLQEVMGRGSDWREAGLIRALGLNLQTVSPFLKQLFDFFMLAAIALVGLTLLAFTKGDLLERAIRPALLALLGFIAGCAATLGIVAIGFGGYVKPRSFYGVVDPADVVDGDSFRIGEFLLRLNGVDAPEEDQVCIGLDDTGCGQAARNALITLLSMSSVQCDQIISEESHRPRDTFGRPLVQCWITPNNGRRVDVGETMIRLGYAVQYKHDGYAEAEAKARERRAGILRGCALRPDTWRNEPEIRVAFMNNEPISSEQGLIGICPATAGP